MCLGMIFPHRFFVSSLVGKQPRKVDLPFRMDVCHLGQATVCSSWDKTYRECIQC